MLSVSGFGAGLTHLGKNNPDVVALCADLTGSLKMDEFKEKYLDVICDISESSESVVQFLTEIFSQNKVDIVIHLAGQGNPNADFIANLVPQNIIGTWNILEACKNSLHPIQKVIFASTNHNFLGHLTKDQINRIEKHCPILSSSLETIETCGGGSARCMMAEVFLPKEV